MIITEPQQKYLDALFIDNGFSRQQRNAFLSDRFGRDIRFLDQLSKSEASAIIEDLKEQKERGKVAVSEEDED